MIEKLKSKIENKQAADYEELKEPIITHEPIIPIHKFLYIQDKYRGKTDKIIDINIITDKEGE